MPPVMQDDALIIAIEQDARLQCERLVSEAEEAAAEMLEAAAGEASDERRIRTGALSAALDRKAASAVNSARTEAAGRALLVRHELAGDVLARVEQAIGELKRERYAGLLNSFYDELKKDWLQAREPQGHAVLLNPADMGLVNDPEAEFRAEESVCLGAAFVSTDGRLRYENTVSSRIKKMRDTLLSMVDRTLFGTG